MSAMWLSCSANLLPMHARGPNPNGTEANGCLSFLAWLDLSHLSGMNCSALSKWASSVLIKSWCIAICTWKKKTKTILKHPAALRHREPVTMPCYGQCLPRQGLCIQIGRCLWRRFWYFQGRQAGVCKRPTKMFICGSAFEGRTEQTRLRWQCTVRSLYSTCVFPWLRLLGRTFGRCGTR